jgi:type IV pilus assembly protein PilA
VVAIIGILAAIAIPNFLMFQLRSKTGEAKTNLAGIRTAEEGYFAEFGLYVQAASHPAGAPNSQKTVWALPALGFDTIGWAPEGNVFYRYDVQGTATDWAATATGDLDGDGLFSTFGYVHPVPGAVAASASNCNTAGVYNPVTLANDLLNTVGPCDAVSGQSQF